MAGPSIPDPFYVEILRGITAVETEIKNLRTHLESHATKHEVESVANELTIHKWVIGGLFVAVLTLGTFIVRV